MASLPGLNLMVKTIAEIERVGMLGSTSEFNEEKLEGGVDRVMFVVEGV